LAPFDGVLVSLLGVMGMDSLLPLGFDFWCVATAIPSHPNDMKDKRQVIEQIKRELQFILSIKCHKATNGQ
jgi:hypothetical protein